MRTPCLFNDSGEAEVEMTEQPADRSSDEPLKIKDLPRKDRPRERLLNEGPKKLSNPELLAILLRTGSKGENVVTLAGRLLKRFRSLRELSGATIQELQDIHGIGPAKSAQILAGITLARRMSREQLQDQEDLSSPEKVHELLSIDLRDRKKEVFVLLMLDGKNRLIERVDVSEGTLTSSLVHPREVFRPAIRASAAAVIFAHNHPSGDPVPSSEDIEITERLVDVGELVGIPVIDHVIIGGNDYRSFDELNML